MTDLWIGDHFSKYAWCTVTHSKEPKNILEALRIFFSFCGKPEVLQSDNGREFVNKISQEYLDKQNVKFVHGRPYHPQSQGFIERINRTIQQSLNLIHFKNPKAFNLKDALQSILDNYNTNYHTTIKMTPQEAFRLDPIMNLGEIERIHKNIKQAFENKLSTLTVILRLDKKFLSIILSKLRENHWYQDVQKLKCH